jgi:hypothetical protein
MENVNTAVETTSPAQELDNTKLYNEEFDTLLAKLDEFGERGYSKNGGDVTIPGSLFAEFLFTINHAKETLRVVAKATSLIQQSLDAIDKSSDALLDTTATLTIKLMKAHLANIEAGQTLTMEQLDAEDAVELITETKE